MTTTPPPYRPSPSSPPRFRIGSKVMQGIAAVVAASVVFTIGYAAGRAPIDGKDEEISTLTAERDQARRHANEAQTRLDDRVAKQAADDAKTKRIEAERVKAERDAAAKVAAEQAAAQAAAQKAADEQARREAQAAQAAAEAEQFAAERRRSIRSDGGVFAIGADIDPGEWRTDGPLSGDRSCYYAILDSTDTTDIATNNITSGPAIMTLPSGKYFTARGCAWRHS